jgi:hypothetical protein
VPARALTPGLTTVTIEGVTQFPRLQVVAIEGVPLWGP